MVNRLKKQNKNVLVHIRWIYVNRVMSFRADKQNIDTQTQTVAADNNTRRPKLASGKNTIRAQQ